ncbi:MAG TPA: HAD hydrolase family protein [Salinivirga sp.]|uniref:KdsC family phosphatase n=1 Tax=Salinivirga sp. TaxID=1970192 RepID=UPI002B4A9A74|nr:HAD hydrolase family protein [Salinivirga sp.]HKK60346.1 HAD hydrolase family protein [Salinivirga sp.]
MKKNFKEQLNNIKVFVFDVDGVFTNGTLYLLPGGELARQMNIRDGFAVKHAAEQGYKIGIITGGEDEPVRWRFNKLGVKDIYLPSKNKVEDLNHFIAQHDIDPASVLYMGDDMPDYKVMKLTGIPTCPADADSEIKQISDYISDKKGGEGCVRDVIEQVLRAQGKWVI